jgi:hypothetical protein
MNDASAWRYTLAQQIAPRYVSNPKVAAVAVEGSVARGYADHFSDLDLAVFWTEPPTAKERSGIIRRTNGRRVPRRPSATERGWWSDTYRVGGGTIDVRHFTSEATERILADVLERYDLSLSKQQHLATLLSALPLCDPSVLTQWQSRARVYPHALSVAMVRAHLTFPAGWEQNMLAERNDLLLLYDSFCTIEKHVLLVLMGLNHLYYPGFQWIDRLMEQMRLAPPKLSARFRQLFSIVGIDPLAGVYQLHELIEETFVLVETSLAEIDTSRARARFRARRASLQHEPDALP